MDIKEFAEKVYEDHSNLLEGAYRDHVNFQLKNSAEIRQYLIGLGVLSGTISVGILTLGDGVLRESQEVLFALYLFGLVMVGAFVRVFAILENSSISTYKYFRDYESKGEKIISASLSCIDNPSGANFRKLNNIIDKSATSIRKSLRKQTIERDMILNASIILFIAGIVLLYLGLI